MSDLPELPTRDDPMQTCVELLPPSVSKEVLVNGLRVPRVSVDEHTSTASIVLDGRLAFDVPIELLESMVSMVANAIAIERGYGCWPRVPEEHDMPKAPAFGPIFHSLDPAGDLRRPTHD